MIPLILKRVEMVTQRIEKNGQPKKGTHYTLQIDLADVSLKQLQEAAMKKPEQILLPPPDESKDELFYPGGGFEPEEDKAVVEEPGESKELGGDTKPHKEELNFLLSKYKKLGGEYTQKEEERLSILETIEDYEKAIKYFKAKVEKLSVEDEAKDEKQKSIF